MITTVFTVCVMAARILAKLPEHAALSRRSTVSIPKFVLPIVTWKSISQFWPIGLSEIRPGNLTNSYRTKIRISWVRITKILLYILCRMYNEVECGFENLLQRLRLRAGMTLEMDAAYVKETLVLELSANRFRSLLHVFTRGHGTVRVLE